ncbi:MAG: glycosyltransferase family 39 protein [bacterium]
MKKFAVLYKFRVAMGLVMVILTTFCIVLQIDFKLLPLIYFLSIILLVLPRLPERKGFRLKHYLRKIWKREYLVIVVLCLLPILVRILLLGRYHGDESLTAFFSLNTDFSGLNFFKQVPNNPAEWINLFPSPYFFIEQKILHLIGTDLFKQKLSVQIYVLIITIFTYKFTSLIATKRQGMLSILVYSVFSFAIYFETIALMNLASTALFCIQLYLLFKLNKTNKLEYAKLIGFVMGLGLLFYTSSYIILPLTGITYLIFFAVKPRKIIIHSLLQSLFVGILVLLPFLT